MSVCLNAFKMLEPKSLKEMDALFEEYKITTDKFASSSLEVMKDTNLVFKIGVRYFEA